jgi:hypothetical protein
VRTLVLDDLLAEFVRDRVSVDGESSFGFQTDAFDVLVGCSRSALPERTTSFLVFSIPVIELI